MSTTTLGEYQCGTDHAGGLAVCGCLDRWVARLPVDSAVHNVVAGASDILDSGTPGFTAHRHLGGIDVVTALDSYIGDKAIRGARGRRMVTSALRAPALNSGDDSPPQTSAG